MSLFQRVFSAARGALRLVQPVLFCCASCNEISVPVKGRLCTSLAPDFFPDLIIVGRPDDEQPRLCALAKQLGKAGSLRYLPPSGPDAAVPALPPGMTLLRAASPAHGTVPLQPVPLDSLPAELGPCFILVPPDFIASGPADILDFFTPNGIPLLFPLSRPENGAQAPEQRDAFAAFLAREYKLTLPRDCPAFFMPGFTRALIEEFAAVLDGFLQQNEARQTDFLTLMALWSFASGRAVAAGSALAAPLRPVASNNTTP
jgi:hypothetical protein